MRFVRDVERLEDSRHSSHVGHRFDGVVGAHEGDAVVRALSRELLGAAHAGDPRADDHAMPRVLVAVVVHSCVGTVGTLLGVERTADGPAEYRPIARVRVVAGFGRGRGADVGARHHRELRASTQPPRATNPAHATLREHRRPPFWTGHADGSE